MQPCGEAGDCVPSGVPPPSRTVADPPPLKLWRAGKGSLTFESDWSAPNTASGRYRAVRSRLATAAGEVRPVFARSGAGMRRVKRTIPEKTPKRSGGGVLWIGKSQRERNLWMLEARKSTVSNALLSFDFTLTSPDHWRSFALFFAEMLLGFKVSGSKFEVGEDQIPSFKASRKTAEGPGSNADTLSLEAAKEALAQTQGSSKALSAAGVFG